VDISNLESKFQWGILIGFNEISPLNYNYPNNFTRYIITISWSLEPNLFFLKKRKLISFQKIKLNK
jgi:hypothetical protein